MRNLMSRLARARRKDPTLPQYCFFLFSSYENDECDCVHFCKHGPKLYSLVNPVSFEKTQFPTLTNQQTIFKL